MSIVRIKNHKADFLVMNKAPLRDDSRLTWKAKGILAYFLCLPDNWEINRKEVVKHAKDGETSLDKGIQELIDFGYCKMAQIRGEDGKFYGYEYEVFETPQIENEKFDPEQDLPETEKPDLVNRPLFNIDIIQYIKRHKKEVLSVLGVKEKKTVQKKSFNPNSPGGKLAKHFLNCIEKYNPYFIEQDMAKWEIAFNSMLFVMGLPEDEIKNIASYSQESEYWRAFITDPFKLKYKYNTLKAQLNRAEKTGRRVNSKNVFDQAKES